MGELTWFLFVVAQVARSQGEWVFAAGLALVAMFLAVRYRRAMCEAIRRRLHRMAQERPAVHRDLRLVMWTQGIVAGALVVAAGGAVLATPSGSFVRFVGVEKPPFPTSKDVAVEAAQPVPHQGPNAFLDSPAPANWEEALRKWRLDHPTSPKGKTLAELVYGEGDARTSKRVTVFGWIMVWLFVPGIALCLGAGTVVVCLRRLIDVFREPPSRR